MNSTFNKNLPSLCSRLLTTTPLPFKLSVSLTSPSQFLPKITKQLEKHFDLSSIPIKPASFESNHLLVNSEIWIMIIYFFLKQNSSPLLKKKNFLLLLQQCINYDISNKQQLLKFMNWTIKKYFSIKDVIKIINNNPLLENKINENMYMKKKIDELERYFCFFLKNPFYFEEKDIVDNNEDINEDNEERKVDVYEVRQITLDDDVTQDEVIEIESDDDMKNDTDNTKDNKEEEDDDEVVLTQIIFNDR